MTIPDLISAAATLSGVRVRDLCSPCIKAPLVDARRVFIISARREGYTLEQVGRALRRHHSTIIHHERRHAELLEVGDTHEARLSRLVHQLTGR